MSIKIKLHLYLELIPSYTSGSGYFWGYYKYGIFKWLFFSVEWEKESDHPFKK